MANIIVEGAIGCGKTSALQALGALKPNWKILPEPVQEWEKYHPAEGVSCNFLQDWYQAPCERHFRRLQYRVIQTLLDRHTDALVSPPEVNVFERSLRAAGEVFVEENRNVLPPPEFFQLKELCEWGCNHFENNMPSIYLYCSTATMVERIIGRSRPSEKCMSLQSLVSIQRRMDEWAISARLKRIDTSHLTPGEVAAAIVQWREETLLHS